MRYVIVSVIKGEAGDFNNNIRKEVYEKFRAKSSKLPAHFTIKAPFEYDDDITDVEKLIEDYCIHHRREPLEIKGYNHFDDRVIYMDMTMSREGKVLHDGLIEEMSKFPYIEFMDKDGKDKIFHITISSKRIKSIYYDLWNYVNRYPCNFQGYFDNVSIYKWESNTWVLQREYLFQK